MEEPLSFAQVVSRKAHANVTGLDNGGESCGGDTFLPGGAGPLPIARPPGCESYADAVKSRAVKLDGVPVSVGKFLGCVESVTNSTMQEQESVLSSWADDDQCFFDSIRVSREERKGAVAQEPPRKEKSTAQGGGGSRQKRGGSRWRFIGGGNNSNNSCYSYGRQRKGSSNENNNNNTNTNNNNSFCGFRRGNGVKPPNACGGRFASLR